MRSLLRISANSWRRSRTHISHSSSPPCIVHMPSCVCCSVFQCVAHTALAPPSSFRVHSALCVAVCCSVLQCVAVCCTYRTRPPLLSLRTYHPHLRCNVFKNSSIALSFGTFGSELTFENLIALTPPLLSSRTCRTQLLC